MLESDSLCGNGQAGARVRLPMQQPPSQTLVSAGLTASVRHHSGIQRHSPAAPKRAHLRQVAKQQECTRITPMDKEELKERIRVPLLGFSAVLISIVAFLLLLYAITVVIRFFFALGSLG